MKQLGQKNPTASGAMAGDVAASVGGAKPLAGEDPININPGMPDDGFKIETLGGLSGVSGDMSSVPTPTSPVISEVDVNKDLSVKGMNTRKKPDWKKMMQMGMTTGINPGIPGQEDPFNVMSKVESLAQKHQGKIM